MKIVALMTVRNEERYLERCLTHLEREGVHVCLIDNGSSDRTLEIAESFRGRNVLRIEHIPFNGKFALKPILENEERLAGEIDADWFIHHDADEIRQATTPFSSLSDGLTEVDRRGYNAVNFDEFVFLPTAEEPDHEGGDFVATMQHYYFFHRWPLNRINAWKNLHKPIDLSSSGGHKVAFEGRHVFETSFILRHYVVLSRAHALAKYCGRLYEEEEVTQLNWHGARADVAPNRLKLPNASQLKTVTTTGKWDRSAPQTSHLFLGMADNAKPKSLLAKTADHVKRFMAGMGGRTASQSTRARNTKHTTGDVGPHPAPFIVGVGRSGSTLLRLMLDAHPDLAIPWETHFVPAILALKSDARYLRDRFFRSVVDHPSWPDFHLDSTTFLHRLAEFTPFTCSDGLRAFFRMYAEKFGKDRWGDKTPPHDAHMLAIHALLPEARFIHIIRDGRDVALSHKGKWFGPGDDLEAQAAAWIWRIRESRRQAQHLPHYMEVRFEELVAEPQSTLSRICDFLALPFSPVMLEYHKTASSRLAEMESRLNTDGTVRLSKERRMEIFKLTNRPPSKDRIERWRQEMSIEQRRQFGAIAGDMLTDLGYARD